MSLCRRFKLLGSSVLRSSQTCLLSRLEELKCIRKSAPVFNLFEIRRRGVLSHGYFCSGFCDSFCFVVLTSLVSDLASRLAKWFFLLLDGLVALAGGIEVNDCCLPPFEFFFGFHVLLDRLWCGI